MNVLKQAQAYLAEQNKKYTSVMEKIPTDHLPTTPGVLRPDEVWRSAYFLATVYREPSGLRISVNRTKITAFDPGGHHLYEDGITWDELMSIKREIGFGDRWAVEVFPPDEEIVNVANMRHLWITAEPVGYGWVRRKLVAAL